MKPAVWEILASVPFQPLLLNVFRRASSYCYREVDVPSPYAFCLFDTKLGYPYCSERMLTHCPMSHLV